MQLPDESIELHYQGAIAPQPEFWGPLAEMQAKHLLPKDRIRGLAPLVMQVRSEIAAERELQQPPPDRLPLHAGFINFPQQVLDNHRRKGEQSELGRVLSLSTRLRENADRIVILGTGGSHLGAKALFNALTHAHHNELPPNARLGKPRIYFAGESFDNDPVQEMFELLENACVDPELPEERWGAIVISKSGSTLELATAYRIFRAEAARFYGLHSPRLRQLIIPVTGPSGRLRELCRAEGYREDDILTIPENIGSRYSVFTPAGLLPAATMGLDVRALLLGAAAMTKKFLEEPFDRNPVLQFAAVNYLLTEELGKNVRVLSVWGRKLEAVGQWYAQLVAESLGKNGRGPTPLTLVNTRDFHTQAQLYQDGPRDKVWINLYAKATRHPPIQIGHSGERDEDKLNDISRRTLADLAVASFEGLQLTAAAKAQPVVNLFMPQLTEHAIGQLLQMLMLATVVEARLHGVNPYSQPGTDFLKQQMIEVLRA
jgi:glucose-6-phosphate isomerase